MEYKRNWLIHAPIRVITLNNGVSIGVYQGDRWEKPELDILVKYKDNKGSRLRTPKHIHWVIDLLIKKEHNRLLTLEFLHYLRDLYLRIERFENKQQQENVAIVFASEGQLKKFEELDLYGEYSIYFIWTLIELFIRMEKNHPNPFIFKDLVDALIEEKDIFSIVSKATHNWK
jgi:hypothetical protein